MDLLAIDLDDADDVQAKIDIKADRKRRAFLESKASYPTEPIVLQRAVSEVVISCQASADTAFRSGSNLSQIERISVTIGSLLVCPYSSE